MVALHFEQSSSCTSAALESVGRYDCVFSLFAHALSMRKYSDRLLQISWYSSGVYLRSRKVMELPWLRTSVRVISSFSFAARPWSRGACWPVRMQPTSRNIALERLDRRRFSQGQTTVLADGESVSDATGPYLFWVNVSRGWGQ